MKLAILMNLGVPWSRSTAVQLAALGHEVHVIDFDTNKSALGHLLREDSFQQDDIRACRAAVAGTHWLSSRWRNNLRYITTAPTLAGLLRRLQPDALLTLYAGGFATLAQLSGFRPYHSWVVGSDVLLVGGLSARLLRSALHSAASVPANGDYLAERTRALAPKAAVTSLLLGIDLPRFPFSPKPAGVPLLLGNRGFNPLYQNDLIVRALAHLDPTETPFRFVFASAGPELARVRALADTLLSAAQRQHVEFAGGVSQERMNQLLAEARVFVSVALSDGTATSLLEAMACGVYPILSDIPQNREWVRPDSWHNGLLVPTDDPVALATALKRVLSVPADLQAALRFNRRQVEARADARGNLRQLVANLGAHLTHGS